MISPKISAAHFQLTGACNLKCIFCGQQNGMFAGRQQEKDLPYERWIALAEELKRTNPDHLPELILWGGEPLLYPRFDDLVRELVRMGFSLGIVTNGTLIDRHADLLNTHIRTVYLSLDGSAEYHNSIRGAGVFEKVIRNLELLRSRSGKLVFLCTLADNNVRAAGAIADLLDSLNPDLLVFQQLMYFSGEEIRFYRSWLKEKFGADDPSLEVWKREDDAEYRMHLAEAFRILRKNIADGRYRHPVRISGHFACGHTCMAPFRRIHIKYNGDLLFCTDFYGFTAGNVREESIESVFESPRADLYRQETVMGANPLCRHCSWRKNDSFRLD